ncbi:hypothetical protein BJY01DRAFT_230054 [Aspergillus pseudoustus]|uniref:Uncharacterized protein n=1 Tax=Aspergillus pseudoustus TaxID=1810923 RepID=A0ABR4IG34_9EURO
MKISEVHDGGDYDDVDQFILRSDENYEELVMLWSSLVRSGLIAYAILDGEQSRYYGVKEDQCWG